MTVIHRLIISNVMNITIFNQTIFALASGVGKSGVAVVRISGPHACDALSMLTRKPLPVPRYASRMRLMEINSDELLDDSIVIYFPSPNSFTGEDVVELHIHGGRSVITGVIDALTSIDDLRFAEPGEFTRRAFENDKFDLTSAEGLADLINSETTAQRRQAQRQMAGELGDLYDGWRDRLMRSIALFEAEIDFSDEDLPDNLFDAVGAEIQKLKVEISCHLNDGHKGQNLRDGLYITIIGPPNSGKSTLLNRLSKRDVSIVSEKAGTTRDILEASLELEGYPIVIADTAGIRETNDEIEKEGVSRAQAHAKKSDLKLCVFDGENWPEQDARTLSMVDQNSMIVINKSDLMKEHQTEYIEVSSLTGEGFSSLIQSLTEEVVNRCQMSASPVITRARHRESLETCLKSLDRFETATGAELKAEDLRLSARALGKITGKVGVEDILDIIFAEFCIGK